MGTNYPGGIDNYQTLVDHVDDVLAKQINDLQDAVHAIQVALGINPKGATTDVSARIGSVEGEFNASTGHKHTGAAGDAPKINGTNVTYASGVTGFTPTTAASALDALAGVRLKESGSNANGEYRRYEDGTQICWAYGKDTTALPFTFPAAFVSTPIINYSNQPYGSQGDAGLYPHYEALSITTNATQMSLTHNTGTGAGYVNYLAIGRWK